MINILKRTVIVVILFSIGCGDGSEKCKDEIPNNYKIFEPMQFGKSGDYVRAEKMSDDFYEKLEMVLEYYKEEFIIACSKVYIPAELFKDKEMMYNYYIKAEQSDWLETIYLQNQ